MSDIVIDTETTNKNPHKAKLLGVSLFEDGYPTYTPEPSRLGLQNVENTIMHNGKYDSVVLSRCLGLDVKVNYDTLLAYYLLHIDRPRKLEKIVKDVFNVDKLDLIQLYNKCTGEDRKTLPDEWWLKVPEEKLAVYAQEDVEWTHKIKQYCDKKFKSQPELKMWFDQVEMPLLNILVQSELNGVKVNVAKLKSLEEESVIQRNDLENILRWMVGKPDLNLGSSKQLQPILYKQLKLPKIKKTKTGWSCDKHTLEKLKGTHAFVNLLLDYRSLDSMLSKFLLPLQEQADKNEIIHPTFNQALTVTRRFSCKEPNLQQIPRRTKLGVTIKGTFVPKSGTVFFIGDYSQIEPRLLAHFSSDPQLMKWYKNNEDIYLHTVELMKKKGHTIDRDKSKILVLSSIYGKTPFGLAKDFDCSVPEAEQLLKAFFDQFKNVSDYIKEQQEYCKGHNGWLKSLAGLPLFVPGINSNKTNEYEEAKRQAVNYRIQGSSQDILKKAIVNIYKRFNLAPVLMVHDEVVYEFESSTSNPEGIVETMETAFKLQVPLKVEWGISDRWEKI